MLFYSLRRCRRVLRTGYKLLKKKGHTLRETERAAFESELRKLDQLILSKRKEEAHLLSKKIEAFIKAHFPKTIYDHGRELAYALIFAIVVAFAIRQFWFELYEVPTGSMRPTVLEQDRMVVSKTTFGINFPFRMKPLLFSEKFIKRAGIIVFTVANMDVADSDMLYFYLFPGKKRYIKRCCGSPGDTLYFYGGRIYGIDAAGNPFYSLSDETLLKENGVERIEHIPFISFEGKMKVSGFLAEHLYSSLLIKQMNLPTARLELTHNRSIEGTFFNGSKWVEDRPENLKAPHDEPVSYSDLWGIGNYAMARLLTKEEAFNFYDEAPESDEALLYLELRHTPNLTYPKPEIRKDEYGRFHPMITPMVALIPLKRAHLDALQQNLFTSRFFVRDGHAFRYQEGRKRPQPPQFDPIFRGVPNGCYEFYYGKGYQVHFGGIRTELPKNHPLYNSDPENIQKLFNQGIHFNLLFNPMAPNQPYNPQRFAYYRDGDLVVMGGSILKNNDPTLIRFVKRESDKQRQSSREKPYIAFVDHGAPLKNGKLDVDFLKAFGLKIPADGTLALGDNYAMSADSRDFGFVPLQNLRGSPSFTFWPPGGRFGPLPQPPYPWLTLPNLIIWILVILVLIALALYFKNRNQKSIFKD